MAQVGEPPEQQDGFREEVDGPLERLPRTRREVYVLFGNPGVARRPIRAWRRQNIVTVRDLPGVPRRWHFRVHVLAEPYVREGLRRAAEDSVYVIERAACWVHRHIRHDPSRPLSLHSWGIAVDFDPQDNGPQKFARGEGPVPWSSEWRRIWPRGVDRAFVQAMESVGFTWGGVWGARGDDFADRARAASYFDPMQFELRDRRPTRASQRSV